MQISWELKNSDNWVDNKATITKEEPEFWKSAMPALHVYIQKNTSWYQAESVCVTNGGHLVSITSQTDYEDLKQYQDGENDFWLGGSDEAVEGNWTWSEGRLEGRALEFE